MKKATVWAHDKFGLKIKDIWQFYQVASFDEETGEPTKREGKAVRKGLQELT